MIALQLAYLAGGVVVVEAVFGYPGIGAALVDAVGQPRRAGGAGADDAHRRASTWSLNLVADIATILITPRLRTSLR